MGMFDEVRLKIKIPWPEVQDSLWQSKDTPRQYLDTYEIREDGSLWREEYDERCEDDKDSPYGIAIYHDNKRWVPEPWDGELEVHEFVQHEGRSSGWSYSIQFWFRGGQVKDAIYSKHDTEAAEAAREE